ncbi:hypothetical protein DFR58_11532 [Anaerobacterium chartisolvens]|uniref:Uncharacterized protein n=1 Tax=Anaerobacterium chartisolvens TaxID=1297424 RepID=A0A369AYF6_9FIRM|nr:hypothetical protein [Anaerobacterium chartisolvens]RCX14309.1 hypothetical protein DFR58_11532 [Anaerobacterium chartisolvens]
MPIDSEDFSRLSDLDKMRCGGGNGTLKNFFCSTARSSISKAVSLINSDNLQFSSLFALQQEISRFNLYKYLNEKNKQALDLCERVLHRTPMNMRSLPEKSRQSVYSSLKWIIESSRFDRGFDNEKEEVVDTAALLLVKSYRDKTVLDVIVDMIFQRHRREGFTYDLIWAAFEARDPNVLIMIAGRLLSDEPKDVELARKLLSFIPCIALGKGKSNIRQHSECINWITENYPFIYYTGESLHQGSSPIPYTVSIEAKYLCEPVCCESGEISVQLTPEQKQLAKSFNKLEPSLRVLLSHCSSVLHKNRISLWNEWIKSPIEQQIAYAKSMGGAFND